MSEFMISVNSRARGERRQLPRTKKVRSAPGAPSAGSLVKPREPSRWSRRRSAHPKLVHVHPCCRLQPETLQLRACLPNEKNSHKQATSSPTRAAPQTGLLACFSHDRLAPPCTTQRQIVTTSVATSASWYTRRYNWCRKHLTCQL